MSPKLLQLLASELDEIRNRINWAENSQAPTDFIAARLAVNEAETTLQKIQKEAQNENQS